MKDDFLKILLEWQKNHWIMFAAQSIREKDTKNFLCNMVGKYKVVLKSKKEPLYQGDNVEEAYKIYKML